MCSQAKTLARKDYLCKKIELCRFNARTLDESCKFLDLVKSEKKKKEEHNKNLKNLLDKQLIQPNDVLESSTKCKIISGSSSQELGVWWSSLPFEEKFKSWDPVFQLSDKVALTTSGPTQKVGQGLKEYLRIQMLGLEEHQAQLDKD